MSDTQPRADRLMPAEPNTTPAPEANPVPEPSLSELAPDKALELLVQDPVGFVKKIVSDAAQMHLSDLKEEAELRGAVRAFSKANPEFERFQPFIMQEVVSLIQNDPDGVIDPWYQLLEKAMNNFKQKFAETVKAAQSSTTQNAQEPPHMETAANRSPQEQPPVFTREQIAKMSLSEFLKNEAAINAALTDNRIR